MNEIKLRKFREDDGPACRKILEHNLEKNYDYLDINEKEAMLNVNRVEDFERIANWKDNRLFVIEERGEIIGYFFFGKEGENLRMKRVQIKKTGKKIYRDFVLPTVTEYYRKWGCKEIISDAAPHLKDALPKMKPGIRIGRPTKRNVGGVNISFIPTRWKPPERRRR